MPDAPHQPHLISEPVSSASRTPEEEARRAAFLARLRDHLQDPTFRQTPGFPLGDDDAILALSDPPYYTACPNPFLPEIIEQWQKERAELRAELGLPDDSGQSSGSSNQSTDQPIAKYHREPFAADVSEGKNNPIYNAHSYHTKVPHPAIMRYILHYTDPGDIVFDGFCGTGMTGVAAQLCADKAEVEKLGYYVDLDGNIYEHPPQSHNHEITQSPISRLGSRKAILNDLSPAATFIAYNYNTPVDTAAFEREANRILKEVDQECGWMYETWHPHCDDPNRVKGKINYTVWSEVFACPNCGAEIVYYEVALNKETFEVNENFDCPGCKANLLKKNLERLWKSNYDDLLSQPQKLVRYCPVLINYEIGTNRYEKKPDYSDFQLIEKIEGRLINDWLPIEKMLIGERQGKDGYHLKGISHLHHFYFRRALLAYSHLWGKVKSETLDVSAFLKFFIQATCPSFTKLNRYRENAFSQVNQIMSGTLFVGSLTSELSPDYVLRNRLKRLSRLLLPGKYGNVAISSQSTTELLNILDNSFDYIFVDPPFGNNLHYSELNFFWEAWLGIFTHRSTEAVIDKARNRTISDYQVLMFQAFRELYRTLKPGHWMTVEFHNSQNRVWNAIQEAMLQAGFVVADVRTLDKQQETYKQSIQKLVKADLVISAYKPNDGLEERFRLQMGTADGAWAFIRYHLSQLPGVVKNANELEVIAERQPYLLFDRMVAFHIQRGATVPLSASEFYAGLTQRFPLRDGMHFLPEQVPEYDRARLQAESVAQLSLFVSDEKSALNWLRQQLDSTLGGASQTSQDLQPQFLRQLHQARHEQLPELNALLEQNFLQDEAGRWYPPNPDKASDLEKLRQRALLREFNTYLTGKGRLKQFRTEAVRAGFADAYQRRDFTTLLTVARRLPEAVLQEDPDLLMYYDAASLREG